MVWKMCLTPIIHSLALFEIHHHPYVTPCINIEKQTLLTYAVPIQRHQNKPLCINSNNSLQFCFLFWQVPLWLLPWLQQHWIREVCRLNNLWTELIICIYPCVSQSKLFFKHNDYIVCMFEKWKFNYIVDR